MVHSLYAYFVEHFWQFFRFGISGGLAAVAGVVTLYVLTDIVGLWYVVSSVISFGVTFVIVFVLQKFWTFKESSTARIPKQSLQNLALSVFNLFLNTALIYVLVDIASINYLLAQAGIYGLIGAIDYFVYKYWIFQKEHV